MSLRPLRHLMLYCIIQAGQRMDATLSGIGSACRAAVPCYRSSSSSYRVYSVIKRNEIWVYHCPDSYGENNDDIFGIRTCSIEPLKNRSSRNASTHNEFDSAALSNRVDDHCDGEAKNKNGDRTMRAMKRRTNLFLSLVSTMSSDESSGFFQPLS